MLLSHENTKKHTRTISWDAETSSVQVLEIWCFVANVVVRLFTIPGFVFQRCS
jgi:hypothetical protein